jgi:hypothetical protein
VRAEELALPERILAMIPPRPVGFPYTREHFDRRTGLLLDPLVMAEAAAHHTFSLLLDPARFARLEEYHARDPQSPGAAEVLSIVLDATWYAARLNGYNGAVQRSIDAAALNDILTLALQEKTTGQVRGHVLVAAGKLKEWLNSKARSATDSDLQAHWRFGLSLIEMLEERPEELKKRRPIDPPAGAPIGCDADIYLNDPGF